MQIIHYFGFELNLLIVTHTYQVRTDLTKISGVKTFLDHVESFEWIIASMSNTTSPLTLHIIHYLINAIATLYLDNFFLINLHETTIKIYVNL